MRLLRAVPGCLFLATLIYAPWDWGGTPPEAIWRIEILLGVTLALWLIEMIINRRWPHIPGILLVACALLTILGWTMFLGARAIYDPQFRFFVPIQPIVPYIFGSADSILSFDAMCRITLLLGFACFAADLTPQPGWLMRIWWTLAGAGASIAFFGLVQKGSGAEMIFWQPAIYAEQTFFATYYYHGNAGAFLNLVLPLVAGLAIRSLAKHDKPMTIALWLSAALIVLIAILSNTSRMAQVVGVLLLGAIVLGPAQRLVHAAKSAEKITLATGAIVVLIAIIAIAQASRLDQPIKRWNELSGTITQDARWLAVTAALPAVRDAGWFGFGPGTFRAAFPGYADVAQTYPGRGWRYLHEDYLQTVIEWGWIGSALWALFFFGGIGVALRSLKSPRAKNWPPRRKLFLQLAALSLAGIALHAIVDFPFQILSLQLYVVTLLGVCWSSGEWEKEK